MQILLHIIWLLSLVTRVICTTNVTSVDFKLYRNFSTGKFQKTAFTRNVNKYAIQGLGRVLTWNVKKLGSCLRQDNTDQLKEVVCVILQSANVIVLQEADNLDLSCLPCNNILKDQYEWPDDPSTDEFKVLIKTKHQKTFTMKSYGQCPTSDAAKKSNLGEVNLDEKVTKGENVYHTIMQRLRWKAEQKETHKKDGSDIGRKLQQKDFPEEKFRTVEGLDIQPLSSQEVPEQEEKFYNQDWFDSSNIENQMSSNRPGHGKFIKKNSDSDTQNFAKSSEEESSIHTVNSNILKNANLSDFKNGSSVENRTEIQESQLKNETHKIDDDAMRKIKNDSAINVNSSSENTTEIEQSQLKNKTHKIDVDDAKGMINNDSAINAKMNRDEPLLAEKTDAESKSDRLKERFHQDGEKNELLREQEDLKERLYVNRERLYNASLLDKKVGRFVVINHQLNSIEREIKYVLGDIAKKRFHTEDNMTMENSDISISEDKPTNRFISNNTFDVETSKKDVGPGFKKNRFLKKSSSYGLIESQKVRTAVEGNKINEELGSIKSKIQKNDPLTNIDFDSKRFHDLVDKVLLEPDVEEKSRHYMKVSTKHALKRNLDTQSSHKKRDQKERLKKNRKNRKGAVNADKRALKSFSKKEDILSTKDLSYVVMTVKSDLNSGKPFVLVNAKLPKSKNDQRACMEKIISDVSNANSQGEQKMNVIIMGDFHFDRLTGSDNSGELYKLITNLQIDGETYRSPITYHEKDSVTTVYGRRFDNILTNLNLRGNLKTIGPDLPNEPETVVMPLTLQRLYNNYMVALYTSENDDSDSIYNCIKAYQLGGKSELDNVVCKDSWVPSSYISDHLPLNFKVKMNIKGKAAPIEINLATWNIQGDTFKERLMDPAIKKAFFTQLKQYHLAVFHEFPPHDRILDDNELGTSDILRLKEGDLTTAFGIYINEDVKDGDIDMFVLRKKAKGESEDADESVTKQNMVTTVGLFAPKIVIDTVKIKPCLYTVKTNEDEVSSSDVFSKIMSAIDEDVKRRKCDFKVLLASLNLDEKFDLDREIYRDYKYINLKCQMTDGDNKYLYNIPRSRDLADYVIILDKDSNVDFDKCVVGLPGDEGKRGIDKLSDFEELTTHYPLSIVVKNKGP